MFVLTQSGEKIEWIGPYLVEIVERKDGKSYIMARNPPYQGGTQLAAYNTMADAKKAMRKLHKAMSGTRGGFRMPKDNKFALVMPNFF